MTKKRYRVVVMVVDDSSIISDGSLTYSCVYQDNNRDKATRIAELLVDAVGQLLKWMVVKP